MEHALVKKLATAEKIADLATNISAFTFHSNGGPREAVVLFSSSPNEAGKPCLRLNRAVLSEVFEDELNLDIICEILNRNLENAKKEIFDKIDSLF